MAIAARGIRIDIGCLCSSREGKEVLRLLFGNFKAPPEYKVAGCLARNADRGRV
jgi:hypothetical protein